MFNFAPISIKTQFMQRLSFSITIKAPAQHVWFALWDDVHYRKWTSAFCEGSYVAGELAEGNKVHFLAPDGGGMYSHISQMQQPEKMSFSHIGELKNFEEQPITEETKAWTGAKEHYTLTENEGVTTLLVEMDIVESHIEYYQAAFPKGLAIVKTEAENMFVTVEAKVEAPLEKVWAYWTETQHITQWNFAHESWHCPHAENDAQTGGHFSSRMEARDGSSGFDFSGIYDEVIPQKYIIYSLADKRKVMIAFLQEEGYVLVQEHFNPESENSLELQRGGWQAILTNFKNYTQNS